MTLDQIIEEWTRDSNVDKTELADESLKIISLVAKYMRWYKTEKLKLIHLKTKLAQLKLAKREFYTMGPHEDTPPDWKLPPQGRVIKNEVQDYIDADNDVITMNLRVSVQQEKSDLLYDIIKELNNRRWSIRAAIDFLKWTQGG